MGDRKLRKERVGVVTSNKMENSVVVSEVRRVKHPKYGKFVLKTKKYVAHEDIAKKDKLGLWAGTFEMPWDYRKKN